jgi:hypothetical protein
MIENENQVIIPQQPIILGSMMNIFGIAVNEFRDDI